MKNITTVLLILVVAIVIGGSVGRLDGNAGRRRKHAYRRPDRNRIGDWRYFPMDLVTPRGKLSSVNCPSTLRRYSKNGTGRKSLVV
jgi:hypothetical protein